ncbi:MAG: hypothetical protein D5R98_07730 [Desulfonatronovibrio sp. MSAO_Bac4]|nr:MAG: hypothetical protein D5R98_07730 [Desulfonatronovibrio sp. MSAO_Bac4]
MFELCIVLIVIGLIISAGLISWRQVIESRKVDRTDSSLHLIKSCLFERMTHSLQYPTYSSDLSEDPLNSRLCINDAGHKDVDACLCPGRASDAWGAKIRFIEGAGIVDGADAPLQGEFAVYRPHHQPNMQEAVALSPESSVMTDVGSQNQVAFILLSLGPDGIFDDQSYETCFTDSSAIVGTLLNCSPDFSLSSNDQFLIITGHEVRSRLGY